VGAWKNAAQSAPVRGLVDRAGTTSLFDLHRWAPSAATARFVDHFWSVRWDLSDQGPFDRTVITFPSLHITHEWGDDSPRHGFPLPTTLVHGVVERVIRTTISERGWVVGARFRPGGFTARFDRDGAAMTVQVRPVDDELFSGPIHLEDDVDAAFAVECAHHATGVPSLCRGSGQVGAVPLPVAAGALEIESRPGVDHADLAVRLGWYDQAHFINDFRTMLGTTPGEYYCSRSSWSGLPLVP
jgi:hypothetical protein